MIYKLLILLIITFSLNMVMIQSCKKQYADKKEKVLVEKKRKRKYQCAYCKYGGIGGFYFIDKRGNGVRVCSDCAILTFDLVLGRYHEAKNKR